MNKNEFSGVIDEQIEILRQLNLTEMQDLLSAAKARLHDGSSRVLIAGDYSRGKTTLLNALLGQDVLKTGALPVPTTNIVRYGEHIDALAGSPDAMVPVALEELHEGEYQQVKLHHPSDLCRGVQWIEHPSVSEQPDGFGELVRGADLVVVVIACDALFSAAESRWVHGIKAAGHSELFFVCNFLDRVPADQIEQVKQAALARLPANADRIFFAATLPALEGAPDAASALDQLRQALAGAIKEIPTRIKQARALGLVDATLGAAEEHLEEQQTQRSKRKTESQEKIRDLYQRYEAIAAASRDFDQDLQRLMEETRDVVETMAGNLVRNLAIELEEYAAAYDGSDLNTALESKTKTEVDRWRDNELDPYLGALSKRQTEIVERGIERLRDRLRRFYDLAEGGAPPADVSFREKKQLTSDVDVSVRGPGIPDTAPNMQLLQMPEALIIAASVLAVLVLRPAGLGVVAGVLGLGAATFLGVSKRKTATRTARRDAARQYGSALRSQADGVALAVWKDVRTEIETSHQSVNDWMQVRKREAQQCLARESEGIEAGSGSDDRGHLRSRMEEVRKALSLA